MLYRIIQSDVMRSKFITLTTTIFVAVAAMLVSLAAILAVHLSGAIDTLMIQAKTPHFMQMHSGALDAKRMTAFAEQNSQVDEFQVLEFLNMEGARIVIDGQSLAGSVQDNGFVTQSSQFDYLLDLEGRIIQAADGEVYVPIAYMKDGTAALGDPVEVSGKLFTVAGFLRDSQMNAMLASSKRFLISANDYAAIQSDGSVEYLIEFRLKDLSELGAFEAAYASAGLEANGPMITYPLFRMLNAMSDGLMIGVILLVSALVTAIALMCIRFTLLAKMEEDVREIGVMKAIGLRLSDIKNMYLAKYAAMTIAGSLLGYLLSLMLQGVLLENIRLYMGDGGNAMWAVLVGIIGIVCLMLTIIAFVNGVLRRFRGISPAAALRFGAAGGASSGAKAFRLSRNRLLGTNAFLGIQDVFSRKRLYATMLCVLILAAFIILVPQNLHHTISSEGFATYMGIGNSDLRIDIQQNEDIAGRAAQIINTLDEDSSIAKYVVLTTQSFQARRDDGSTEVLKIELGDHSVFPVQYAEGRAPASTDEIALSVINGNELGKRVGDGLTLLIHGQERQLMVSGIYSDVTNGGKTAKAMFTAPSTDIMWSVIGVELRDPSLASAKVAELKQRFNDVKVSGLAEYMNQTFGRTVSSIGTAARIAIGVAIVIMVHVTLLFMRMLILKDRYAIAVLKAIGFTNSDVARQYVWRSVCVLVLGLVVGTLLANTVGEGLAGAVLSTLGVSTFTFEIDPLSAYLLCPLMMGGTVLAATLIGTSGAGKIQISDHIKE
ncbi:FtsX-like permease family protein [Paenibacillus senegalimassiliensis]|uniref:FtsX-like permease family protein n=1 Tax=Paenibacillus senegalimassiliensis TaxID=1737426 RepID=UPI00073F0B16|nr:FtsX-like permease family protein [Paenibacillus senegalimassiliensis]